MKNFPPFPWKYLQRVLYTRESFFETSMRFTREEFGSEASPCPNCGKKAEDLLWVPVDTSVESWWENKGQSGFVTCCRECQEQIDFFVDVDITEIEREVREAGGSSQGITWRMSGEVIEE